MKNLNSYLIFGVMVLLFSAFSISKMANNKSQNSLSTKIDAYLSNTEKAIDSNEAIIYSDFIIKENGDFYTVDFMVTENDEIQILNKDFEDEYYILDQYSTQELKWVSVPVVSVYTKVNNKA